MASPSDIPNRPATSSRVHTAEGSEKTFAIASTLLPPFGPIVSSSIVVSFGLRKVARGSRQPSRVLHLSFIDAAHPPSCDGGTAGRERDTVRTPAERTWVHERG